MGNSRSRAFEFAASQPWAIQRPYLKLILDIARRAHTPDFEAVVQRQADRESRDSIRQDYGPVAVINIIGPIFRYANFFTAVSGATSVQGIAAQFRAALDDPAVAEIILNIDSPGGEIAGISELSQAIYDGRGRKPVVAYADHLMASAAYWIGSAASRVAASPTALLGSIGVLATITREQDPEGEVTYEFVSSTSPKKLVDPETDAGRAQIQAIVDDLGAVFAADVARNRGVAVKTVLDAFGQGDVLIASKAVTAGMADEISTFDALLVAASRQTGLTGGKAIMSALSVDQNQRSDSVADNPVLERAASAGNSAEGNGEIPAPRDDQQPQADVAVEPSGDSVAGEAAATAVDAAAGSQTTDARVEALNYAAEVAELCTLAGQPGKAAGFIRAGMAPADVRDQLQKARAEEDVATQVHSHVLPETSADCGWPVETATNPNDSPLVKAAERLARAGKEK